MRNIIIIASICLACVSCKVDFDFSGLGSDPLLYLDMNLDLDLSDWDSGVIPSDRHLSMTGFLYGVPSAAGERKFPEGSLCRMEVYHNSELVWTRDDVVLHEFAGQISAELKGVVPGDRLKVVARAEGFPEASAETVLPQAPPQVEVSHTRINASLFRVSLTFEDDPQTEDCYAFAFTKGYFYDGHLQPSGVEPLELSFGGSEETSFLDIGPFDVIWNDGEKFYGISDRGFNGQKKTLEFNVDYPLPSPDHAGNAHYCINVCRVSPERLRYETACFDKGSNILGFMGLAPSTFSYTNVTGGTGCISCSHSYDTDWVAVPPLEGL